MIRGLESSGKSLNSLCFLYILKWKKLTFGFYSHGHKKAKQKPKQSYFPRTFKAKKKKKIYANYAQVFRTEKNT